MNIISPFLIKFSLLNIVSYIIMLLISFCWQRLNISLDLFLVLVLALV
jgi:hypothetical protein